MSPWYLSAWETELVIIGKRQSAFYCWVPTFAWIAIGEKKEKAPLCICLIVCFILVFFLVMSMSLFCVVYAGGADSGGSCLSPTHQLPLTKSEFSDCSDLMMNRGVQVCVWILGLTALLGNLLVILMRVVVKEDNKVHSFLLKNLAMSDLLMGIYLLIIAMKDVQWQGVYFAHDYKWRSGVPCTVTGVLSMAIKWSFRANVNRDNYR